MRTRGAFAEACACDVCAHARLPARLLRVRGIPEASVISDVLLADQPTKAFIRPEDIGALVLHLCGPHSAGFNGACLSIDGGWVAR